MTTETKDVVQMLQQVLTHFHYEPGPIDGLMGPRTRAAYEAAMVSGRPAAQEMEYPEDENTRQLMQELEIEEGCVLHAYRDHLGWLTIGIGRLIDERKGGGISRAEAEYLKRNDILRIRQELDAWMGWWRELDDVRQRALQNMCFQLGIGGLMKFTTSMGHVQAGRWEEAAISLGKSLWARQTPKRAQRVINMLRTGESSYG